jgi:hypothetical protein
MYDAHTRIAHNTGRLQLQPALHRTTLTMLGQCTSVVCRLPCNLLTSGTHGIPGSNGKVISFPCSIEPGVEPTAASWLTGTAVSSLGNEWNKTVQGVLVLHT